MDLKEIAHELVEGCRAGKAHENLERLYAEDAVSVEPTEGAGGPRITEGRAGIAGKHDWWAANAIEHRVDVHGPYLHGDDRFGVIFNMDVTLKPSGERHEMQEIAVYHVADGKIVREEFFYGD